MENFKAVLIYVVVIFAVMVLGFGLTYVDWASYNFFAPKYENTRRQVFEQSNAYKAGMIRDLENLQMEYQRADSNQKDALRSIILHRFSVYSEDSMPANLRAFYHQLQAN